MRIDRITVIVLTALLSFASATGHAADQLFDTQAATKHIEQGIAHLKAKNFDAAISEFEESASIQPDAEAFYYLGYAYYLKGKKKNGENRVKSLENFDKAFELDPNFSPTRLKPNEPAPLVQQQLPEQSSSPTTTQPSQPPQGEQPVQPAEQPLPPQTP